MRAEIRIDPEFAALIPPPQEAERAALEAEILAHGVREPLVVWKEERILVDGHTRRTICEARGIPYEVVEYPFPDRDAARCWIIDNAFARRNLTKELTEFLIGSRYLAERKHPASTQFKSSRLRQCDEAGGETREKLALREGVSPRTVERFAEFARALNAIAASAGVQARNDILAGVVRVPRRSLQEIAERSPKSLEELRQVVGEVRATRPSAKRAAPAPKVAAFSTRGVRKILHEDQPDGSTVYFALLSCGHKVKLKPRSATSKTKSMPCPKCGSGSRPAWERQVKRVQLEATVTAAIADPYRRSYVFNLVQAAIDVLTVAPMTELQVRVWAGLEAGLYGARILVEPEEQR